MRQALSDYIDRYYPGEVLGSCYQFPGDRLKGTPILLNRFSPMAGCQPTAQENCPWPGCSDLSPPVRCQPASLQQCCAEGCAFGE